MADSELLSPVRRSAAQSRALACGKAAGLTRQIRYLRPRRQARAQRRLPGGALACSDFPLRSLPELPGAGARSLMVRSSSRRDSGTTPGRNHCPARWRHRRLRDRPGAAARVPAGQTTTRGQPPGLPPGACLGNRRQDGQRQGPGPGGKIIPDGVGVPAAEQHEPLLHRSPGPPACAGGCRAVPHGELGTRVPGGRGDRAGSHLAPRRR